MTSAKFNKVMRGDIHYKGKFDRYRGHVTQKNSEEISFVGVAAHYYLGCGAGLVGVLEHDWEVDNFARGYSDLGVTLDCSKVTCLDCKKTWEYIEAVIEATDG